MANDPCRALAFGSKRQLFDFGTASIWGMQVTPDTQLALLGVFNKCLDYLVDNALENISLLSLTIWMTEDPTKNHPSGVHVVDYEMKEELVKPWIAGLNHIERWRVLGWKGLGCRGMIRFAVTIVSSICFLLLGAAINTVGLPKARWYPDLFPKSDANQALMKIKTPRMTLANVDWMNYWTLGWETVGGGPQSWTAAIALASASTYSALNALDGLYGNGPGWSGFNEQSDTTSCTAINTTISGSMVESISIQGSFIVDMYNGLQKNGPTYAKGASGMMGSVNLTLPRLTTTCSPASNSTTLQADSITVKGSSGPALTETLDILLGPNAGANFGGATCSCSLREVLLPINFWYNGPSNDGLHFWIPNGAVQWNVAHGDSNPEPLELPITADDANNLNQLAIQFSSMLPYLNGLLPGSSLVQHVAMSAHQLRTRQPAFQTDVESLTPAIAIMLQHLITIAQWNMTASAIESTTSYPLRWYVYGSGPRLSWEWAAAAVLCFFACFLFYDIFLVLYYRIAPGPWLKVGGMMVAANAAEKMASLNGSIGGVSPEGGKTAKYLMRSVGRERLELVDDAGHGEIVEKTKLYGTEEDRFILRIRSCMNNINAQARRTSRRS